MIVTVPRGSPPPSGATTTRVTLYVGGVFASATPTIIETLLGSCIAVCMYDPVARVGAMNHFMLPDGDASEGDRMRFGVYAMDRLMGLIMRAGGDRRRVIAKVFGGGHVLDVGPGFADVARRNIEFVRECLATDGVTVVGADVGGPCARQIRFETATGRVSVRRLPGAAARRRAAARERVLAAAPAYGDVSLFE